ncbi:MAG: saccharopine dehydrogenase NADP-binding domain-containing protein [Myxococcota bacterium]
MSERPHDIALYGATGFTGRLTAAWLAERGASFLLAGRSRSKLERVRDELGLDVPIVVCSSDDPASLRSMAEQARVVLTTVGPYARYGMPVVEAAVAAGSDYVDITGEPDFVSESLRTLDGPARDKGLRIVHCCGFDSLPHDLGAWFTVQQLPSDRPIEVSGYVSSRGSFSGGTWASALEAMGQGRPKKSPRERDPAAHPARIRAKLHKSAEAGGFGVPLPTIDPVIVVRSGRALRYGTEFTYGHYARVKTKRYLVGGALAVGGVLAAAQVPALRRWLEAQWPSGSGPDAEAREKGWFKVLFVGRAGDARVITQVRGDLDPGYGMTSRWVGECALALAHDRDVLPERFGVLTPVAAMADAILARMPGCGTAVEVVQAP